MAYNLESVALLRIAVVRQIQLKLRFLLFGERFQREARTVSQQYKRVWSVPFILEIEYFPKISELRLSWSCEQRSVVYNLAGILNQNAQIVQSVHL